MATKGPLAMNRPSKHTVVVGDRGRVVIPSDIRKELGIEKGDTLIARVSQGQLVLESRASAVKRIQDKYLAVSPEVSLSDELLAERKMEAKQESEAC